MAQQTATEWLIEQYLKDGFFKEGVYKQAIQMELDMRKEDFKIGYNHGYLDAQCNHINDAGNFANEQEYLNDKEITDYTIGPFGTPEKI
jgi:hypothetical protein